MIRETGKLFFFFSLNKLNNNKVLISIVTYRNKYRCRYMGVYVYTYLINGAVIFWYLNKKILFYMCTKIKFSSLKAYRPKAHFHTFRRKSGVFLYALEWSRIFLKIQNLHKIYRKKLVNLTSLNFKITSKGIRNKWKWQNRNTDTSYLQLI